MHLKLGLEESAQNLVFRLIKLKSAMFYSSGEYAVIFFIEDFLELSGSASAIGVLGFVVYTLEHVMGYVAEGSGFIGGTVIPESHQVRHGIVERTFQKFLKR
jgi:hypothetical protein